MRDKGKARGAAQTVRTAPLTWPTCAPYQDACLDSTNLLASFPSSLGVYMDTDTVVAAIIMEKGGVGKTTVALNLAVAALQNGRIPPLSTLTHRRPPLNGLTAAPADHLPSHLCPMRAESPFHTSFADVISNRCSRRSARSASPRPSG